jgi:RNA polymerase sigma factor (sigma-70 family)
LFTFKHRTYYSLKKDSLHQIKSELLAGNNSCLKVIFEKYGNYCVQVLRKKTRCTLEDAEDILMDAVLNFREKIITGQIEFLTNTKSYLFNTCYNMWLVKYQKEKVQDSKIAHVVNELYDTDNVIHRKGAMKDIGYAALNKLGDKCQQILNLYYLENLRMEDISTIMGFASASVAKTSKSRCFKKLMEEVNSIIELQKESTL